MKLHTKQFGWKACRILTITNTAERADNMRFALAQLTKSETTRQLFYFTHASALKAAGDILKLEWIDGNDWLVTRMLVLGRISGFQGLC